MKHTKASSQCPKLVILDGHHSHKTLEAVIFARNHGINLLTLPPNSTHKMQPLDRTFFKSLNSAYNRAADSWMVSNPGKKISLCDIVSIFGKAFLRSATADKAVNGFLTSGIWPFDPYRFDEDFTCGEDSEQSTSKEPVLCTVTEKTDNASDKRKYASNDDLAESHRK